MKAYILVDTMKEGTVQNIAMFNDYEEANRAAMAAYGDEAFAEEINGLFRQGTGNCNRIFYTVAGDVESWLNIFQLFRADHAVESGKCRVNKAWQDMIGGVSMIW